MEQGRWRKWAVAGLAVTVAAGGAIYLYQHRPVGLPEGIAAGNGRLEATEVDVATKIAGRLAELGPREGDWVSAGAVLGRLEAEDVSAPTRFTGPINWIRLVT